MALARPLLSSLQNNRETFSEIRFLRARLLPFLPSGMSTLELRVISPFLVPVLAKVLAWVCTMVCREMRTCERWGEVTGLIPFGVAPCTGDMRSRVEHTGGLKVDLCGGGRQHPGKLAEPSRPLWESRRALPGGLGHSLLVTLAAHV